MTMVETTRREFLSGGVAALAFAVPPGGFARAIPQKEPRLVIGMVADTHHRAQYYGQGIDPRWSGRYFSKALEYFRSCKVDAVVHLGDMAHKGLVMEMKDHAEIWNRIFPGDRRPDGGKVARIFIDGNHEWWHPNDFTERLYDNDAKLYADNVLSSDLAGHWERIWGEKYEGAKHWVVKGFHFFGKGWLTSEAEAAEAMERQIASLGAVDAPVFVLSHARPYKEMVQTMKRHGNMVAFFGHYHKSAANWSVLDDVDGVPMVQCPPCRAIGDALPGPVAGGWTSVTNIGGIEQTGRTEARQGYVLRVYDDMIAIERHEFSQGGRLGADWALPLGWRTGKHPFSKGELKKVIGEPQFPKGAKLTIELSRAESQSRRVVRIPLANGNPDSRVFAYEAVVVGDAGAPKYRKAIYAVGCSMGVGHEPNKGVTLLEIPKAELPEGKELTIAVRPVTSLGTVGRAIAAKFKE